MIVLRLPFPQILDLFESLRYAADKNDPLSADLTGG